MRVLAVLALALALALPAAAIPALPVPPDLPVDLERVRETVDGIASDPAGAVADPESALAPILDPPAEEGEPAPPGRGRGNPVGGIGDALGGSLVAASLATLVATVLGLAGFALVTRYVSPKEALQNPQRAMLYGYVRGHPGVHLKQLSDEFAMKTSSILWHIRKLESAELVRSERANGFRVFYPVEGGIEVRRVGRAITALHNANAQRIYEAVQAHPGAPVRDTADRLGMHGGTVRWHMRKLREYGLVEELVRDDGSRFYPTPLGRRALETLLGESVTAPRKTVAGAPVPVAE